MQNWVSLFKEFAQKVEDQLPEIEHIDLWHNQVSFLETEHPFATPAVFFGFRSNQIRDMSTKVQEVNLQVDVYLFYETLADTYHKGKNQDRALAFLESFDKLFGVFHGSEGTHYSSMRRISLSPVDTGGSGNLYVQSFTCTLIDYTAQTNWGEGFFGDLEINGFDISNSES